MPHISELGFMFSLPFETLNCLGSVSRFSALYLPKEMFRTLGSKAFRYCPFNYGIIHFEYII